MNSESTLTKYIVIVLLVLTASSIKAQAKKDTLSEIVIGHKCLFNGTITERFEINYKKKNLYRLTIYANYLHIKGEKFRTKIKTSKKEWFELNKLAENVKLVCREESVKKENEDYFISFYKNGKLEKKFSYSESNVPSELKQILNFIRKEITVGNSS
ncbi:hypothetical protein [Flammeovirga kamogawensis]|uniref:DUF4468 domain-containing protein n=1 Tax=Flammeovirga kamogawensis TaxID=373891 RepID=A0ABX8H1C7_9BACT|nr:hypothetical protein [Flammeovirga kamogawensis]QWG09246.1 hypothetical protein KM029_21820 [Flammeovirga kamogawensis]QWG09881.1 hypothetical protein KM029_19565 [Flammeovirga kamogawensis]TRX64771.1 hypothetical protein EO216_19730 [Flammeovirga kamogawensis]TRX65385.1 hypothetical protein EO216_22960 [Flammeovirga kamogawensis]